MKHKANSAVSGVILAGGRGTRMGGQDKGLLEYRGQRLIEHVIARFAPQVGELLINANRNIDSYRALGYPVITDTLADYPGPLAGMLAGLEQASGDYVVFVPCDAPDLPMDLVERLWQALQATAGRVAMAHDGDRSQPLHAMLHRDCRRSLQDFLAAGDRKADLWMQQAPAIQVDFRDQAGRFFNLNSLAGLQGNQPDVPGRPPEK